MNKAYDCASLASWSVSAEDAVIAILAVLDRGAAPDDAPVLWATTHQLDVVESRGAEFGHSCSSIRAAVKDLHSRGIVLFDGSTVTYNLKPYFAGHQEQA